MREQLNMEWQLTILLLTAFSQRAFTGGSHNFDVSTYCITTETYTVGRNESYILTWRGDFPKGRWFPCRFSFTPEVDWDRLCVDSMKFVMPTYLPSLKYYRNKDDSPDKTYNTVSRPSKYCTTVDTLHVEFDCTGGIIRQDINGSYVELKVWAEKGEGRVNVGLIVGCVVAGVVVIIVIVSLVIFIKCYRRQGARGFIHQTFTEVNASSNQYPSAVVSPYGVGYNVMRTYPIEGSQAGSEPVTSTTSNQTQDMYPVVGPTTDSPNPNLPWPPKNEKV